MKKGKRVKPKFPIEYRLLITQRWNEHKKATVTLVGLRTVIEFRNFLYEIVVEPMLDDRTLHLKIHGLRAPQVTIPGTGPAKFSTAFSELEGSYTVIVTKPNGEENTYGVHIAKGQVVVEQRPRKTFTDIVTKEEEW